MYQRSKAAPLLLLLIAGCLLLFLTGTAPSPAQGPVTQPAKPRPLLRDFIGLNTHTVLFRPALYKPVTHLLRDYHDLNWDIGDNTASATTFPLASNGVNWQQVYGSWKEAGYRNDVCLQFNNIKPEGWKDMPRDARAYGEAFARYFGPSGHNLAQSAEIGNEPGSYPDPVYRTIFTHMAQGIRAGDPRLKIATCAVFDKPSGSYHKSISVFAGLEGLYDAISVHSYAQAEPYPTWRRSYPEDPKIPFLTDIQAVIDWRNAHAPGKEIWLTEFGWDATTQPQDKEGDFKNWVGVTDTQQAQYIVRAYLVFAALDINRAYLYWFNDDGKARLHAASGLTRNYVPRPAFHATAHLLATLGNYRFRRVVQRKDDLYIYEFEEADTKKRIWVAWSPTGSGRVTPQNLSGLPGKVTRAERMPLTPGTPAPARFVNGKAGTVQVEVSESPLYLFLAPA